MNYKAEKNFIFHNIFDDLFVLELANNHWGKPERGLKIISDYSQVVRFNNVRAAIKLQIRDVENFIHKQFRDRDDIRYIKKTRETVLSRADFVLLVDAIRKGGCIPMATPFDEHSVDLCMELGIEILKLASSDINDWILIEKIAKTKKPVIASTGGASEKDTDDLVTFFHNRGIPLALNHCVSVYPSEDSELELNQIDYLRERYPGLTIGFSTHEYHDWSSSIMIAVAKGARTFERHIDIDDGTTALAPYNSLPEQIDQWFKSFKKAVEMSGQPGIRKRNLPRKEIAYLDALVRGIYLRENLAAGHVLCDEDVYLAIPLLRGQVSCREFMRGEKLLHPVLKDDPLLIDCIESPYSADSTLRAAIYERGLASSENQVHVCGAVAPQKASRNLGPSSLPQAPAKQEHLI